jgi:hypothetical protein
MLLEGCSALVLVVLGKPFFAAWLVMDAAGSAAEGHVAVPLNPASFHTPAILEGVVDVTAIHVHDVSVVVEVVTAPLAAGKAEAAVAKAVVDAAVVADVPAPIALMKMIPAMIPAPVGRRPQRAGIWHRNPCSRNPVVAALIRVEGPVAGCPHQAGLRAVRLLVNRQRGRRDADADQNARVRGSGNKRNDQRQQKPACREQKSHGSILHLSFTTNRNQTRTRKNRTTPQCISGNARQTGSGFLKIFLRRPSGS